MYWHLLWKYIYIWTFISRKNEKEGENSSRNNSHLYIEKHVVLFTTGTTCPPPILKSSDVF